jgi:hypothetical protein
MLKLGYVVHFVGAPIMHTLWPWACAISMFQGGLHFALKAWFDPDKPGIEIMYLRLVRKFVLPGTIFLSFLLRYADIENVLVPLNRICDKGVTKAVRDVPWLSTIRVLNERVLAFDVRHRDVVGAAQVSKGGKNPTLDDVVNVLIDNFMSAEQAWGRRVHREWGLFRSMWTGAVLLDRRLDRQDPETWSWISAFAVLGVGCLVVSALSLYLLFFRMLFTGALESLITLNTEVLLGDAVLIFHGLLVTVFLYRTIRNMFYFAVVNTEDDLLQAVPDIMQGGSRS